jgi:hypothetical protein
MGLQPSVFVVLIVFDFAFVFPMSLYVFVFGRNLFSCIFVYISLMSSICTFIRAVGLHLTQIPTLTLTLLTNPKADSALPECLVDAHLT